MKIVPTAARPPAVADFLRNLARRQAIPSPGAGA